MLHCLSDLWPLEDYRVCLRTMLCEEVTVDDVDHAVQLLPDQATRGHLQDELTEQFTAETEAQRQ